jgi:hypothetical protein
MRREKSLGYVMVGAAIVLAALWLVMSAKIAMILAIAVLILVGLALAR